MARIVVGLSGGVDSSVAAHLLVEQGHEVIGLFMRNWVDDSVIIDEECPWVEDSTDAMLVAEKLGIPFQVIDLSEEYKNRIVDYMFDAYSRGITPNPDVLCNREIKHDVFLEAALKLGADGVPTGHYCQKAEVEIGGRALYRLLAGADLKKDQSYFLCQLNQHQLKYAHFPIGHLQKPEVRAIAEREGFVTAHKKDSQGLCFVGKVRLPDFLQQRLEKKEGRVIEIPADASCYAERKTPLEAYTYHPEEGKEVGMHPGAHYFTIGQRKGLRIGGYAKPLFVIATDTQENVLYVGQGEDHPGLWREGLFIAQKDVHWIRPDLALRPGESEAYRIRIRYRQPLSEARLESVEHGLNIYFNQPLSAVTPGQFAAWYRDDELVGSGVIA